jgi:tripartite-type tricarboxylate transporter receptor subunit TctC
MLTRTPAIVGANPDVAYDDVTGLVAAAKAKPGTIITGGTLGSTSHFVFLLLEDASGIKLKHVSYDGTRERMTALLAKNIEIGEINLAAAKKYIQTSELKALGITTAERDPNIPDVPTLKEQGIDLVYGTDRGVSAPKGTPQAAIDLWAAAFEKAAMDPAVVQAMVAKGTAVNFLDAADSSEYWSTTFEKWKGLAKKVGMYQGD